LSNDNDNQSFGNLSNDNNDNHSFGNFSNYYNENQSKIFTFDSDNNTSSTTKKRNLKRRILSKLIDLTKKLDEENETESQQNSSLISNSKRNYNNERDFIEIHGKNEHIYINFSNNQTKCKKNESNDGYGEYKRNKFRWRECSRPCGGGIKIRPIKCKTNQAICGFEKAECNNFPCKNGYLNDLKNNDKSSQNDFRKFNNLMNEILDDEDKYERKIENKERIKMEKDIKSINYLVEAEQHKSNNIVSEFSSTNKINLENLKKRAFERKTKKLMFEKTRKQIEDRRKFFHKKIEKLKALNRKAKKKLARIK